MPKSIVAALPPILALLAATLAAAEEKAESRYTVKTVEGFSVHVADDLLTAHQALGQEALRLLESHLYHINRVVPPKALAELRKVHLWLHFDGKAKCAQYHPSREWLKGHGWNTDMTRCVDLGNADNFMRGAGHQPAMVLHELAHAYHDQVLGFSHAQVEAAHQRAVDSKTYDKVLVWNGHKGRAYAMTNPKEYFAETSEAFFSTNDVYPFVRAELREHDPEMFKLLETLWAGPPPPPAPSGLIAPGAKLELLADGFKFTEGPAADAQGNVLFTDQPNDRILKWSTDGKLSTFLQPSGRSNGLCFDAQGTLWACADDKNELWRIDPQGKPTVVVKDFQGKLLNGPNDLWIRPDGLLYFTDPFYKRAYWTRGPSEQDRQAVYALAPDAQKLTRVADDLRQPNGIIGTPDGKTLYVADIGAGKTYAYDIQPDGSLANKRLFCSMGSDGMTLDSEGNVYLTGKGVTVFDRAGKQIEHIAVPEGWTANVCFGGKDRQTLFITAGKGFYGLRMRVKGAGSQ